MPVLEEGLKDKALLVAWNTADAIRRLGPKAKATVPLLTELLKHDDRDVRIVAAQALSTMGGGRQTGCPRGWLLRQNDPAQEVQITLALAQLGPNAKDALPALIERLKNINVTSRHPLLLTIGAFGSDAKDAVPALVELLKNKDVSFHLDAMIALGQIGPAAEAAVPQLQAFLANASEYPRAVRHRWAGSGLEPRFRPRARKAVGG